MPPADVRVGRARSRRRRATWRRHHLAPRPTASRSGGAGRAWAARCSGGVDVVVLGQVVEGDPGGRGEVDLARGRADRAPRAPASQRVVVDLAAVDDDLAGAGPGHEEPGGVPTRGDRRRRPVRERDQVVRRRRRSAHSSTASRAAARRALASSSSSSGRRSSSSTRPPGNTHIPPKATFDVRWSISISRPAVAVAHAARRWQPGWREESVASAHGRTSARVRSPGTVVVGTPARWCLHHCDGCRTTGSLTTWRPSGTACAACCALVGRARSRWRWWWRRSVGSC